jgi:fructose-bisphosphate aldolase class II
MINTKQVVDIAWKNGFVIPAFNIPYLPMVKPVVEAVRDENSFALVQVARIEWERIESKGPKAIYDEYQNWKDDKHTRLHLDHIPVIDEDNNRVDYLSIIKEAIDLGYESVMIDASRLPLEENIRITKEICTLAHQAGIPCEAELGAIFGHESGPIPPYEEIFKSGKGFTKVDDAAKFVEETGCDWLSIAIGNIHGAISEATRGQEKPASKLNIEHLQKLKNATDIPLVLHGGSGIPKNYIMNAIKNGIAKINVAAEIRATYERVIVSGDVEAARAAVYKKTREIIKDYYEISGTAEIISEAAGKL